MAARRLSPLPEVHGSVPEDAYQLGLGLLWAHALPGVAGGEPVAPAPEGACDLADVYSLGAPATLRAPGDLPPAGPHRRPSAASIVSERKLPFGPWGTSRRWATMSTPSTERSWSMASFESSSPAPV